MMTSRALVVAPVVVPVVGPTRDQLKESIEWQAWNRRDSASFWSSMKGKQTSREANRAPSGRAIDLISRFVCLIVCLFEVYFAYRRRRRPGRQTLLLVN